MAKPSSFVILCGLCSWKNIHGGHGWHSILKYNYCTECAKTVHASKLRVYKPDKLGFFTIPCYVQCALCNGQYPKPTNLMRGGQAQHFVFLLVLVTYEIWGRYSSGLARMFKDQVSYTMWLYIMPWYGSLRSLCHAGVSLQSQWFGLLCHIIYGC